MSVLCGLVGLSCSAGANDQDEDAPEFLCFDGEAGTPLDTPDGEQSGLVDCGQFINRAMAIDCAPAVEGCRNDADCEADQVCLCPDTVPLDYERPTNTGWPTGSKSKCVPASCRVNADCASNECSLGARNDVGCGADGPGLACRNETDCTFERSCSPIGYIEQSCYVVFGSWGCNEDACSD